MEQAAIAKQMIDFQRTAFDNVFNTMVLFQDQSEQVVNTVLEQATWIPAQGKNVLDEWVRACKKSRDDFKTALDKNFDRVEELFVKTEKSEKGKTKKSPEA